MSLQALIYRHFITVGVSFGILILINMYYLFQLLKLKNKAFHLLMFTLLQLCYMCFIICYVFAWQGSKNMFLILECPYWFLEGLAHLVFAIKYWVLAKKLQEIRTGTVDRYLTLKFYTIFVVSLLFLTTGTISFAFDILYNNMQWIYYCDAVLEAVPGWIVVALIIDAFSKMQTSD